MSIFDRILLYIALLPKALYKKLGVNVIHLEAILTAKLTIDNRRQNSINQNRRNDSGSNRSNSNVGLFFGSLLIGLVFLISFFFSDDMKTTLTVFFSLYVVLLSIFLITDFTSVLIDIKDNQIILPKPITDATFVTSRLLHITIRIGLIAIPLTLPSTITFGLMHPLSALPIFLLMIVVSSIFSILLINTAYLVILKITTPAKFQSIISYIQIFFAIIIYGSYQILPRVVEHMGIENIKIETILWVKFLPPYWFAASCDTFTEFNLLGESFVFLILSFLTPIVSIFVIIKYFAPSFNRKLTLITASAVESNYAKKIGNKKEKVNWSLVGTFAKIVTSHGSERAGFHFSWIMMSRSRDFKIKVYPSIGYVIVIGLLFFLRGRGSIDDVLLLTSKGKIAIIWTIYFCSFILVTALTRIAYSDKYKAAWIFLISPIKNPGEVICGSVKAAISMFYSPIAILLILAGFLIGYKVMPNIILGCINIIVISAIYARIQAKLLPFSESDNSDKVGRNVVTAILLLIIPGILGFFHYFIFDNYWAVIICIFITAFIPGILFDSIKNIGWDKIK